jgi:DNA-binding response OmpR family regulator
MSQAKRVLIIDDEIDFTFFVKRNLETTGEFEVFVANDGAHGLEMIKTRKPDIILLDIVMPDLTGPDVAEFLLNNEDTKQIPFIFLTAIVTKDELGEDAMKEIKGHPFIQKPVETKALLDSIRAVLTRSNKDRLIADILAGKQS